MIPFRQDRIDHGKLIRWTKGFGNPNTEGKDCAAMFRKSLEKYVRVDRRDWHTRCESLELSRNALGVLSTFSRLQNVPIKMTSIINDTTGTLIASNYVKNDTKIACIFGTGCNAAYMEHIKNIPKIKHLNLPEDEDMAINCE